MRALVAVVDAGGFTAAAATLGMSQPAVSHAIAALEAELGVMLLDRGRSGVRPTETGQRVVVEARAALAHVERLHREARGRPR